MDHKSEEPYIVNTKDGSTSLFSPGFNQHYHNPNGAVSESRHVFFDVPGTSGALETRDSVHIFELGFGTGLNLLLLLDYLKKVGNSLSVSFTSIEAFPIKPDTARSLDFGNNEYLNEQKPLLTKLFEDSKPGMNRSVVSDSVKLSLFIGFYETFAEQYSEGDRVDFIFHDAFSPVVNPDLWKPEVFHFLMDISHEETILSTYCASSVARAAMAVAGWKIARARGALGKREMTIASPSEKKLEAFKRVNEQRLADRYERGDFNSNGDL